jgi:hypothetical protein
MRTMGRSIAFLALILFLLPALTAQEKKDAVKKEDEKKVEEKKDAKDPAKKDEAKDPEKKEEKKAEEKKEKKKKDEEKVEYGQKITTKILSMRPESNHEFTVELQEIDPERVYQFNQWKTQRMIQIAQQTNPYQRQQQMLQFQIEMQRKSATDVYKSKPVDVRAVENVKVRSLTPPIEYDDQGNLKKWTQKQLAALRANSKLPGFPTELDNLKVGQTVELYLVKAAAPTKGSTPAPAPKKKAADDDDIPAPMARPEVVMIVIIQEPQGR